MRQVLIEIFEPHHYEDENGYRYWYNSYGEIRKKQDSNGYDVWFSSGNDGIWQGYRYIEPGYVYAPYVPLQIQVYDLVTDPGFSHAEALEFNLEEFTPRKGILSRYATTTVNNNYYGTINIRGT